MGAKQVEDLAAFRLAAEFRDQVVAISRRSRMQQDRSLCDQIRRAATSAPANIAEGFGRYGHGDFARSLEIALGSLAEARALLTDAHVRGYIADEELERLISTARRAVGTLVKLRNYLRRTPTPDVARPPK